jgi:hypothetical protein
MTKISRAKPFFALIAMLSVVALSPSQGWSTLPVQAPSHLSVPSAPPQAAGSTQKVIIPPAAIERQIQQLERAKHVLELSAGNDRRSRSAVAARHIQFAINELKIEMEEKAKEPAATPGSNRAHVSATSSKRTAKPSVSKE